MKFEDRRSVLPTLPPPELIVDALVHAVLPALLTSAVVLAALLGMLGRRAAFLGSALALVAGVLAGNFRRGALEFVFGSVGWRMLPWATALALVVGLLARA